MMFRELRESKGFLTGSDLAEAAGVKQTTVSQLDLGKIRDPRYSTVKAIADALGTTPIILAKVIERTAEAADVRPIRRRRAA